MAAMCVLHRAMSCPSSKPRLLSGLAQTRRHIFSGCRDLPGPPADCLETTLSGASFSAALKLARFWGMQNHRAVEPTNRWEWVVPSRIDVLLKSSRIACNGASAQNDT